MTYIQLLKSIHDRLLDLIPTMKFDKTYQVHFARVALYASLVELTGAMICLIENNGRVALPSTFRTFLEASVELKNLNTDPSYIEHMYASHMKEWLAVLRESKNGSNPYLSGIGGIRNLDELIARDEGSLRRLQENGKRPLSVYERFERAGMVEEYRSLYNFLSCDSHSNIRALIGRHLDEDSGRFEVVMYRDEPIDSFAATLDSTAGILLHASLETHRSFETGQEAAVEEMLGELARLRKARDA
jgi:Family of unknown function (DUF5677)